MFGLEKYADSFDRMHASVQRDFDKVMLEDPGKLSGKTFGADSWLNYGFAVPNAISWSVGTFVMAQGKALVDVLRLGEGVKEGTVGGVFQDGLRLLQIIPIVGASVKLAGPLARTVLIRGAASAAGQMGQMSCGPTSIAVAGRVSGQASFLTLEEVGNFFQKGHPNSPNFPGMFAGEVNQTLKALSLNSQELNLAGQGTEAVEAMANQGRGPIIIGVQWWETAGGITRPAISGKVPTLFTPSSAIGKTLNPGGIPKVFSNAELSGANPDHWLAVFRSGGKVMVADQFGIRPIADLGKIGGGNTPFTLATRAFLVPEGGVLGGTSFLNSNRSWLAASFTLNMVVVNAPQFWKMDAAVQQAQGKPIRPWPGMPASLVETLSRQPGVSSGTASPASPAATGTGGETRIIPPPANIPPANLLSATVNVDAQLVLSKMPYRDTREYFQLRTETGLGDVRLRNALLLLVNSSLLQVTHWFQLHGLATPGVVRRALTAAAAGQ